MPEIFLEEYAFGDNLGKCYANWFKEENVVTLVILPVTFSFIILEANNFNWNGPGRGWEHGFEVKGIWCLL